MNLDQIENSARVAGDDDVLELVQLVRKQEAELTEVRDLLVRAEAAAAAREQYVASMIPANTGMPAADPVVEANVELLRSRSALGIGKYGTTLADSKAPLRDWLEHALLESLDCANYLQTAMHKIDAASASGMPAVTVDTPHFRMRLSTLDVAGDTPDNEDGYKIARAEFISHIDGHTSQSAAVEYRRGFSDGAKLVEDITGERDAARDQLARIQAAAPQQRYIRPDELLIEGRTVDGNTIDLPIFGDGSKDGKRLFIVALPAPQQHAQAALSEGEIADVYRDTFNYSDDKQMTSSMLRFARAILAASQQPAAAPKLYQHDDQERSFIGKRLGRLSVLADYEPFDQDEFYYRSAFSILGEILREFEKRAAAPAIQQEGAALDERYAGCLATIRGLDKISMNFAAALLHLPTQEGSLKRNIDYLVRQDVIDLVVAWRAEWDKNSAQRKPIDRAALAATERK